MLIHNFRGSFQILFSFSRPPLGLANAIQICVQQRSVKGVAVSMSRDHITKVEQM